MTKLIALVALVTAMFGIAAAAQSGDVMVDEVITGEPGEIILIETVPTTPGVCDVVVRSLNNDSVHLGTNIIVGGVTSFVALDVEDTPQAEVEGVGSITVDDTLTVSVQLGPDGISSGGIVVDYTCSPPETTTSVTTPPTTSTTTPGSTTSTTTPSTTTPTTVPPTIPPATVPPPVTTTPDYTG